MDQLVSEKQVVFALTDIGNADRFVDRYGAVVKYCYEWEKWLVWDGRRWIIDADAELTKLAHIVIRSIYSEGEKIMDSDKGKQLVNMPSLQKLAPGLRICSSECKALSCSPS